MGGVERLCGQGTQGPTRSAPDQELLPKNAAFVTSGASILGPSESSWSLCGRLFSEPDQHEELI